MERKISLKAARINAGMTLEDVSAIVRVSIATLSRWENYVVVPGIVEVQELCRLYRVPIQDIFIPEKITEREAYGKRNNHSQ